MKVVSWRSPSNIALVKYWGKKDKQIPLNPSISFTLQASYTETKIEYKKKHNAPGIIINFLFEGKPNNVFEERISKFIQNIIQYIPVLNGMHLIIESSNSFPHSSGIASSASAMSALALCLVSIEKNEQGKLHLISDFFTKASFIARLGSGSAARSVYGGTNLWGYLPEIQISNYIHKEFMTYNNAVLIVSKNEKKVLSSMGHSLMNHHPYTEAKIKNAFSNAKRLLDILRTGDQYDFALLVESEALALHAMMMTSSPAFILMEPNTLHIINQIQDFRNTNSIPICFTLDAGANVHLLYPEKYKIKVTNFIMNELVNFCHEKQWIDDKVGKGSQELIID
jgi:diphosphomevalonate decarboxylase